jgi:hypothetical protein
MIESKFPEGWDEDQVLEVLAHYEGQTEDEAVAEDEAGMESSVPIVRGLIAKRRC